MPLAADFDCLRRTVYGEARGQPFRGQIAVAWVVLNRARHPSITWWGEGIAGVCLKAKQFSCWNPDDPNSPLVRAANDNMPSFIKATAAAALVLSGEMPDPTQSATHYHADSIPRPPWTVGAKQTVTIGNHIFYRDVP
jgi:N-acetylmuramoyl-L-alanine amidase